MSEENNNEVEATTDNNTEETETTEVVSEGTVEVPWEDMQMILFNRGNLSVAETQLGQLTAEFERRKSGILRSMGDAQNSIQQEVKRLREKTNISSDVDCYLNLPEEEGGPGKFVIQEFDNTESE